MAKASSADRIPRGDAPGWDDYGCWPRSTYLAQIESIEACPPIAHGEGSVVTAGFKTERHAEALSRVEFTDIDGRSEQITGTREPPVWSLDRNTWVGLGELEEGERVAAQHGPVLVASGKQLTDTSTVYNIEVAGEHVYQVGELGVLVHNACPAQLSVIRAATHGATAHTYKMKSIANGLVAAGNTTVRTNQALVYAGQKLSNLRPDIQWVQGGKVVGAEITSLTGKAADAYHLAREATMKQLLGNAFGGYIRLYV